METVGPRSVRADPGAKPSRELVLPLLAEGADQYTPDAWLTLLTPVRMAADSV